MDNTANPEPKPEPEPSGTRESSGDQERSVAFAARLLAPKHQPWLAQLHGIDTDDAA